MIRHIALFGILVFLLLPVKGQQQDTSSVVIVLQDVNVGSRVPAVVWRGDTVVFNASACRLAEGDMLLQLVRRLPGVVVDADGGITCNGKTVSEIKINGRDYFRGNNGVAMKNIRADMVREVKVYEEESRESQLSGIPETGREQVMDVVLKDELKNTFTLDGHTNLATRRRYDQNLLAQEFADRWNASLYGNMRNVPEDNGFDVSSGLSSSKDFGASALWANKEGEDECGMFKVYGSLDCRHNDDDIQTLSSGETFLPADNISSFSNSYSKERNRQTQWEGNVYMYWRPDSCNVLSVDLSVDATRLRECTIEQSATFGSDPYLVSPDNPLKDVFVNSVNPALRNILVNRSDGSSMERCNNDTYKASVFAAHRFDTLGTTLSANVAYSFSRSTNHVFSLNNILYGMQDMGQLPVFYDQYIASPSRPRSFSSNISFSRHLTKLSSLFIRYQCLYTYSNEDRSWYELDRLQGVSAASHPALGWLPMADSLALAFAMENSQYTSYRRYDHKAQLGAHLVSGKWTFRPSVDFNILHSRLDYTRGEFLTGKRKNDFYLTASLYSQYKFSDSKTLRWSYNTYTTSPSLLHLIDIPDESNPLCVTRGNPGLRDPWSHDVDLWYQCYNIRRRENVTVHPSYRQSFRVIAHRLTYDALTGRQTFQADNIDGNWSMALAADYNRSFGAENAFNISVSSDNSYSHDVDYVALTSTAVSHKNTMHTFVFNEKLRATYRTGKAEFILNGGVVATHSRGNEVMEGKLCTVLTSLLGTVDYDTPWNMHLSTDLGIRFRRGYTESALNTTEQLWNVRVTQSILRGGRLSVGLRYDDILHRRRCIVRHVSAHSRTETITNRLGSFLMLTLQYRLWQTP